MASLDAISDWPGRKLHGEGEQKLGTIENIYLDAVTDEPSWRALGRAKPASAGRGVGKRGLFAVLTTASAGGAALFAKRRTKQRDVPPVDPPPADPPPVDPSSDRPPSTA